MTDRFPAEMAPAQIAHRLMLIREAFGLSKSQMADKLDIARTYWSRFETGKRPISPTIAAQLVMTFGVTLDFIYLGRWDKLPLDLAERMRKIESEHN